MSRGNMSSGERPFTYGDGSCSDAVCTLKAATICLLSGLTVAGNLLVLATVTSTRSLRNSHGILLISLALADLTTGLVSALSAYPSVRSRWPYGGLVCAAAAFTEAAAKKASLLTLMVLGLERYLAVVHPFRYGRLATKRRALACAAACWLCPVGFFAALRSIGLVRHRLVYLFHSCTITYQSQLLSAGLNVGLFIVPSMLLLCITSILSSGAMRRAAAFRSACSAAGSTSLRAAQFFRMSRLMAVTFYACWAPHVFVGLASVLLDVRRPLGVYFVFYWLHISNSLWNVVIYFAMNSVVRRSLRARLRLRTCRAAVVVPCRCRCGWAGAGAGTGAGAGAESGTDGPAAISGSVSQPRTEDMSSTRL